MLFTVLGVIALFLRERNTYSTVSGQDESFDRQKGLVTVHPVAKRDGREIGDSCEESSLHLEEQIKVPTDQPSLEEPVDGQSEEPSLVEPVTVPGEEQSLVEPDSVHSEEHACKSAKPGYNHDDPPNVVSAKPGCSPNDPLNVVSAKPGCSHDDPQIVVSAKPGCSHDDPSKVVSAKPGCSHDDPPNVVSAKPGCSPNEPLNVVSAKPGCSHDDPQIVVSAKLGCSHDDPPEVVSAKLGCKDVGKDATCQTKGAVPPQPKKKDKDTNIIEINSEHYEIGAELGKGGYGSVFAGTRLKDGLQVAVKIAVFRPKRLFHVDDLNQLLPAEIALHFLATKGPEVKELVQLLDWKVEAGRYFMVLERPIPCVSVGDFLRDHRGRIPEDVLRKIMFHTTIAAETCHSRGVLHRDIKPDNLLMNPQTFEVKLTDFGCSVHLTKDYYTTYLGTEQFIPPEFKRGGYYFGDSATVWSLGILQFLLMYKKFPENPDLRRIKNKTFYQFGRSEECCDFISGCLQTNPWSRSKLHALRVHAWFKKIIRKI
ncbi:serine/threonine-protein kinase pim-2-like [Danio rerio]|uniref:Serine/threonine-protein kinase pim-2-like n=1 Tax=Danio rerio TaxID=7955 RepID=A0AC58HDA9_DANRE